MTDAALRRHLTGLLALAAAALLSGCATPHLKPKISQAVLDARAHRNAPAAPACPTAPLAEVSPVLAGFPFDEATLADWLRQSLEPSARWLACHSTLTVIKPDADGHGTAAEQDRLAAARGAAVRDYLAAQGVPAGRIRVLARGQAEPAGEHFLIRAEGRRW